MHNWGFSYCKKQIPISHVLLNSWQTIQIIRGTEYPGSRSVTGGNLALGYLWSYANSLFLPFRDLTGGSNNCEMASIFSLAPLGLVLSLWLVFKKKTKDSLFYVLIFLIIPLTVFAFRGFPLWLAKFTLLSNVTENRIRGAWEFIDLILLFRALPKFRKENLKFSHSFIMIAAVALMAVLVAISGRMAAPAYISWGKFLGEVLFAGFFFWAFVKFSYKRILGCVLVLMVLSGATVNPLAHGTKSIYQSSLGQKIAAIALQDKSLWLVEADGLIDFPIMLGAPTVNSVNIYPDLPRWEKLDQGSNKNIYNRYAHINVRLENKEPTQFSPGTGPDNFKICLNVQDLSKLQVHYLLTRRKLEELADAKIKFVRLTEDQGLYIYRAVY